MSLKEKIIQIYLTLVLSFLSFFKILIVAPFILQVKIESRFLVNLIDLIYKPAYLPGEILIYFTEGFGMLMILTGFIAAITYFVLIIVESFLLSKLIIFIFKKIMPENFFENAYFVIKNKINNSHDDHYKNKENSKKFEKIKYLLPVIFFVILIIVLYLIILNLSDKEERDRKKQSDSLYSQADRIDDKIDGDGDGLTDKVEFILGIDRYSKDSDSDGFSDYDELKNGHNPFLVSPQDELNNEMQAEIQEVLFGGEEINFSRLESIREGLKKQVSEKLCQNNNSSDEDLSDRDKTENAVKSKNPCLCSKIIEIKERNYCFSILGALLKDESLCSYVLEEGREEINGFYFKNRKDECFSYLMSATSDERYCYKISKESRITSCLIALILKTKRYNLCDSIENVDEKDKCYWTVAIFLKNGSLCDKISPDNKNGNDREGCRHLIKKAPC